VMLGAIHYSNRPFHIGASMNLSTPDLEISIISAAERIRRNRFLGFVYEFEAKVQSRILAGDENVLLDLSEMETEFRNSLRIRNGARFAVIRRS
jgi:hypothetical protein